MFKITYVINRYWYSYFLIQSTNIPRHIHQSGDPCDTLFIVNHIICMYSKLQLFKKIVFNIRIFIYEILISKSDLNGIKWNKLQFL